MTPAELRAKAAQIEQGAQFADRADARTRDLKTAARLRREADQLKGIEPTKAEPAPKVDSVADFRARVKASVAAAVAKRGAI